MALRRGFPLHAFFFFKAKNGTEQLKDLKFFNFFYLVFTAETSLFTAADVRSKKNLLMLFF